MKYSIQPNTDCDTKPDISTNEKLLETALASQS